MRRVLLLTLLALAACTPSQDTAGTGTPTSDPADLAKLGTQIDKSDQRIAAAKQDLRDVTTFPFPSDDPADIAAFIPSFLL